MEPRSEPANTVWSFPFPPEDWEHTPTAVQAYVRTLRNEVAQLQDRVETLEARLTQNSTTSSRPPSSDSPYKKPRQRDRHAPESRRQTGPSGPSSGAVAPHDVHEVRPERCACGNTTFAATRPYYTHQVLELPPIALEVTALRVASGVVYGLWQREPSPSAPRACHGLWTTVQCAHG